MANYINKMLWILIIIVNRLSTVSSLYYCDTWNATECLSCSTVYLVSSVCTIVCPSGYSTVGSVCNYTGSPPILFTVDFSQLTNLQNTGIGPFLNYNNSGTLLTFNSTPILTPMPTLDRGFYFAATSVMNTVESSYIPSPDQTIKMWIKIIKEGYIFSISEGAEKYLIIQAISGGYQITLSLCNINTTYCGLLKNSTIVTYSSSWQHTMITAEFTITGVTLGTTLDLSIANLDTLSNFENTIGYVSSSFQWTFGIQVVFNELWGIQVVPFMDFCIWYQL